MNCAIKKDDVGVYATSCTSPKQLMAFFTMVLRKQFENIVWCPPGCKMTRVFKIIGFYLRIKKKSTSWYLMLQNYKIERFFSCDNVDGRGPLKSLLSMYLHLKDG